MREGGWSMAGPSKVEFPGKKKAQRMRARGTKRASAGVLKKLESSLAELLDDPGSILPIADYVVKRARRDPVQRSLKECDKVIAKKNGRNLGKFIEDFKVNSPDTKIRLIGHSLGTQVILSTLEYLAKKKKNAGIVEGVYFFGASITDDVPSSKKYGKILQNIVNKKIVNHYSPSDEVLGWADKEKFVKGPLGLNGATGKTISKYHQTLLNPKNHRFASYVSVLKKFP